MLVGNQNILQFQISVDNIPIVPGHSDFWAKKQTNVIRTDVYAFFVKDIDVNQRRFELPGIVESC